MEGEALYEATIVASLSAETVKALDKSLPRSKQDRFSASVSAEKGKLLIHVKAKDATALRAALNSYLRILQAVEKVV